MIGGIIDYFFKPFICCAESNWQSQVYNRFWYIGAVISTLLLFGTIGADMFGIFSVNGCLTMLGVTAGLFVFNIFQLALIAKLYPEHCKMLYKEGP